eukprot:8436602-Pyramimonas_sp.AAC.1
MLAIAVGGTWPRGRLLAEVQGADDDLRMCPRCLAAGERHVETPLHGCWTCPHNKDKKAYQDSDKLLPAAVAQHEQCPEYWLRGLIPKKWTLAPAPAQFEDWHFDDNTVSGDGVFGSGTQEKPIYICGDASGGPDSMRPARRRVGFALVHVINKYPFSAGAIGHAPLPGRRQT